MGLDQARLHVRDGLDRAAVLLDSAHLLARALREVVGQRLDHV